MTEMTLAEAIAEVMQNAKDLGPWTDRDLFLMPKPNTGAACVVLNAVASGDLIPRTDAERAVALAYQRAARECKTRRDLLLGQNVVTPIDAEIAVYEICEAAILALAPAEPLAEVQALKAERDVLAKITGEAERVAKWERARAEAAETEVARLNTLEAAADVVLRYLTNPDWADQNSATFRNMPWQALYNEMRKDRDDFPALIRTFLEAFTDPEARAALTPQKDATP